MTAGNACKTIGYLLDSFFNHKADKDLNLQTDTSFVISDKEQVNQLQDTGISGW